MLKVLEIAIDLRESYRNGGVGNGSGSRQPHRVSRSCAPPAFNAATGSGATATSIAPTIPEQGSQHRSLTSYRTPNMAGPREGGM